MKKVSPEGITEENYIIFKHSNRCPVSAAAREVVARFESDHKIPVYEVVVQEQRSVSDAIEDETGVTHETPQVIFVRDGDVVWHASHENITGEALRKHVENIN